MMQNVRDVSTHVRSDQSAKNCVYSMVLETNKENWESCFKQVNFANLIQSWCYGEAKSKLDGWVVRRGVIKKDGMPIALCQWLEKSILRLGRVIRINRGPVFFNTPNFDEKFSVYRFIGSYFGVRRRNFLLIAPALEDNLENKILLHVLGYKKRTRLVPWKSALIHLKKTEQELRASLKSRLRNYLKHAEAENHVFEISTQKIDFSDTIDRYIKLQNEKDFTGVSDECMKLLFDLDNQDGNVFITRIKNTRGELLAEKLLTIYGNQCTPLIAWTSELGTKSHAMHLLMWKTILHLKSLGLLYFDLGGYNERERPSVCQFKKGFGGEEYCLVGEYRGFL